VSDDKKDPLEMAEDKLEEKSNRVDWIRPSALRGVVEATTVVKMGSSWDPDFWCSLRKSEITMMMVSQRQGRKMKHTL
jgi:hypothetical protein